MKCPQYRSPITDYRSPVTGLLPLLLAAYLSCGFLGFGERPAAVGNQLFSQGKYDEAVNKYGEALVEDPDSPALNFNMGDAHYKAGNYTEALASFGRVHAATDSEREARVAYNVGNVTFRTAAAAEAEKPQEALKTYAEALAAYRRALGIDPRDEDAKINYEFTVKRMQELKERIEKQKQDQQQQDQQQQDQQKQQQDQQQDQQEQQADDQQQQQQQEQQQQQQGEDKQDQQEQQAQQDQGEQQQQEQKQQQQVQQGEHGEPENQQEAQAQAGEEGEQSDEMSKREAGALVDAARNDELRPEDFIRRAQGGALAQPAQDW